MNNKIKNIKSIDDLKNLLENPSFTLDNLRDAIPELKSQKSFDDKLTIQILRKLIDRYDELDIDDLKEMYCNPDFFDQEYDVQDNESTIEKIIELIQYWKYVDTGFPFVIEEEKKHHNGNMQKRPKL
jgi:hypothetical protein